MELNPVANHSSLCLFLRIGIMKELFIRSVSLLDETSIGLLMASHVDEHATRLSDVNCDVRWGTREANNVTRRDVVVVWVRPN